MVLIRVHSVVIVPELCSLKAKLVTIASLYSGNICRISDLWQQTQFSYRMKCHGV